MEYIKFNNGELFPKLGLGTYKLNGKQGQAAIETAISLGYRQIDTAQMYENEQEVGKAISNSSINRSEIFITTKIWPTNFKKLIEATEISLKNLKTEQIDLLLLHWPAASLDDTKKGLELLNTILAKDYAKSVGVSNFNIELIDMALKMVPVVCNQVEYHALLSQQKLLDHLRKNKLSLTAYYPLAHTKLLDKKIIKDLAVKYNKSSSQIALRWLVQQESVAAIPKSGNAKRQEENLNIFDFSLTEQEMKAVYSLGGKEHFVNAGTAPKWDV